jgi:hypothetical protein
VASLPRIFRYFRSRFYVKKRGDRHTGSDKAGSAGLMAFFGVMAAAGICFFAAMLAQRAWPEWRVNQEFVPTTCRIVEARIEPNEDSARPAYRPVFDVRYVAGGQPREARQITWDISGTYFTDPQEALDIIKRVRADARREGSALCWYDRRRPQTVVLTRGYSSHIWLILLLPGAFVLLGVGGSVYYLLSWRMSAEYRKVFVRQATALAPQDAEPAARRVACVPGDTTLTDSPGTRLAYRLPLKRTRGWALLAMVAGCLVLCIMVSVFLALAVSKAWDGEWDWLLIMAGLLFAVPAVWLLRTCLVQLNHAAHLGRTLLEISHHPLHPGESCRVFFAQFGRLRIKQLRLALVCVERATYQQGTNTRSESREVVEQEVFLGQELNVAPDKPLEVEREFLVPPTAMHSFRASSNEIAWMLVVEASPQSWPEFRRTFPLVIHSVHGGPP